MTGCVPKKAIGILPGQQQIAVVIYPGLPIENVGLPEFPDGPVDGLPAGVQSERQTQRPQLSQKHKAPEIEGYVEQVRVGLAQGPLDFVLIHGVLLYFAKLNVHS